MKRTEEIAKRVMELVDPWDRENDTIETTVRAIKENPEAVIEFLLDIIDDLQP